MSTDYEAVHAERYARSFEWLQPLLRPGMLVLETGARSSFSDRLQHECKVCVVATNGEDLRTLPLSDDEFVDVELCMEVFEHLHDQEAKPVATEWRATGTRTMLAALYSALKPGGVLFLTTPNACSANVLLKLLTMRAPMMFRPHVREYAPHEIVEALEGVGFAIERFETIDVWHDVGQPAEREAIARVFEAFPSPHRGEDIFVIARKPSAP